MDITKASTILLLCQKYFLRSADQISMNVPNKETKEAIEEVRQMKLNPSLGKSYTDVDEMMRELLA